MAEKSIKIPRYINIIFEQIIDQSEKDFPKNVKMIETFVPL
mgnify:CR=1 FL=1